MVVSELTVEKPRFVDASTSRKRHCTMVVSELMVAKPRFVDVSIARKEAITVCIPVVVGISSIGRCLTRLIYFRLKM